MTIAVAWLAGAERDLEEIADYIAEHDSLAHAEYVIEKLLARAQSLAAYPDAGVHPRELAALGNHEYRQLYFKPYRLIYRVGKKTATIYLVADGRRDMQSLLAARLLR